MAKKEGFCFVWKERIAKRGGNDIVWKFIEQNYKNYEEFIFWSDNCSGQNKNRYFYIVYMKAAH